MKKILLASTALVASAGIAAADVAISGSAEMGVYDNGNDDLQYHTDIDVTFKMSGETDGGISFGASIDLDESDDGDAFAASTQGGETIFVSYGGATLTMGSTDGAFDFALPEMGLAGGSIADDETGHKGFNGGSQLDNTGDDQVARFDYAFDAFTVSLSAEQQNNGNDDDTTVGFGVKYSGDLNGISLTVGAGYQKEDEDNNITGLAVTAGFSNGFSAGITASKEEDPAGDIEHIGVGLGYEMGALAIGANWGEFDGPTDKSGYGLAVSYDLGGGLSAKVGYGNSSVDGQDDVDTFSAGLAMSF